MEVRRESAQAAAHRIALLETANEEWLACRLASSCRAFQPLGNGVLHALTIPLPMGSPRA